MHPVDLATTDPLWPQYCAQLDQTPPPPFIWWCPWCHRVRVGGWTLWAYTFFVSFQRFFLIDRDTGNSVRCVLTRLTPHRPVWVWTCTVFGTQVVSTLPEGRTQRAWW